MIALRLRSMLVALAVTAACTAPSENSSTQSPDSRSDITSVSRAITCSGSSGGSPYVSYCGSKQGRVFVRVQESSGLAIFRGDFSMDSLGQYSPPANLGTASPGAWVTVSAWIDVTHNRGYNAAVDPYQALTVQADPTTGVVPYPDFELADPVRPLIPSNPPSFVLPVDSGAAVGFEPLRDGNGGNVFGAYEVTAHPVAPSMTCVPQSIAVRAEALDVALFSNLDNSCSYTFSYGGMYEGVALTHGPSTSSVAIGPMVPGGSYAVTGSITFGALASYLSGASRAVVFAFDSSGLAGAASVFSPSMSTAYQIDLVDGDYRLFTMVDYDGDGEIAEWDLRPDANISGAGTPVTVSGANVSSVTITLITAPAVALAHSEHSYVSGAGDLYDFRIELRDGSEQVVNAQVTGESGLSPATTSSNVGLWYSANGGHWDVKIPWGSSPPSLSSAEYYIDYDYDALRVETGWTSSTAATTLTVPVTGYVTEVVESVSSTTSNVSWSWPSAWGGIPPGGCSASVNVRRDFGTSGNPSFDNNDLESHSVSCSAAGSQSFSGTYSSPGYVALIRIYDANGNLSQYIEQL